ncbi:MULTISPECIES: RHS repeat-associated core domain-containing protein [unclassified Pseudomonas]|uniref:RHS repeat-associated core domain-containing protein n=1 Tax=unclassified Pseudomonas TaxID=196821 RepID=UPI000871849D|nr:MULTISPECIES: RHS repeat-associated core domain-containing protein [unclassified Pseudomonas]SCW51310.1 RHS repeat-associated core domain-containing protein [Pseudomonas sp. NFACC05-1]SDW73176.1 RHS repeat-associated core domain-containing protein [Pseudomonas sp. NFACC08-1]
MTQSRPNDQEKPSQPRTVLLAVDLKNSVLAELDASNPNRIAYSPYGHQSAQHGVISQLGFNGERREAIPQWYFLGNGYRVYNPRLMRFHSPDSLSPFGKGGLNAYMYCGGEPVMNSDPTGHYLGWASSFILKFIGGLRTAMTRATSAANSVNSAVSTIFSGVNRARNEVSKLVIGGTQKKMSTELRKLLTRETLPPSATTRTSKIPSTKLRNQEHGRTYMTKLKSTKPSNEHLTLANEAAKRNLETEREFNLAAQAEQLRSNRVDQFNSYRNFGADSE